MAKHRYEIETSEGSMLVEGTRIGRFLAVRHDADDGMYYVDHLPTGRFIKPYRRMASATAFAEAVQHEVGDKLLKTKSYKDLMQGLRADPVIRASLATDGTQKPVPPAEKPKPVGGTLFELVLINPKTHELVFAKFLKGTRRVYLYQPGQEQHIGEGYLDGDEKYEIPDQDVDKGEDDNYGEYMRAHTPNGVRRQGKGYGFLLYGSLAYLAYEVGGRDVRGCCSPSEKVGRYHDRSYSAQAFWERAVENGVAREADIEVDTQEEHETEYDPPDDCDATGDDECTEVINTYPARIRYYSGSRQDVVIQYMAASMFRNQGVVLEEHTEYSPEGTELPEIPTEVLLGLNLGVCSRAVADNLFEKLRSRGVEPAQLYPLFETLPNWIRDEMRASGTAPPRPKTPSLTPNSGTLRKTWDRYYDGLLDLD